MNYERENYYRHLITVDPEPLVKRGGAIECGLCTLLYTLIRVFILIALPLLLKSTQEPVSSEHPATGECPF